MRAWLLGVTYISDKLGGMIFSGHVVGARVDMNDISPVPMRYLTHNPQSSTRFASGRLPIPAKGVGEKHCVSFNMN